MEEDLNKLSTKELLRKVGDAFCKYDDSPEYMESLDILIKRAKEFESKGEMEENTKHLAAKEQINKRLQTLRCESKDLYDGIVYAEAQIEGFKQQLSNIEKEILSLEATLKRLNK